MHILSAASTDDDDSDDDDDGDDSDDNDDNNDEDDYDSDNRTHHQSLMFDLSKASLQGTIPTSS